MGEAHRLKDGNLNVDGSILKGAPQFLVAARHPTELFDLQAVDEGRGGDQYRGEVAYGEPRQTSRPERAERMRWPSLIQIPALRRSYWRCGASN